MSEEISAGRGTMIKVWDAPVRLFHWLLVGLVGFSWWSGEEHEMEWHRMSGYAILALLVFRLFWGFAGSRTARFSQFVRGPAAVIAYAKTLGARGSVPAFGHNPLGGWSVVLLIGALSLLVVAGLFSVDVDGFESGPLADYVTFDQGRDAAELHEVIFNVVLTLVALHVAAIIFYRVWKRQNLVAPMIHGRASVAEDASGHAAGVAWSLVRAAIGIALAVLVAYLVANGFVPGRATY